MMTSHGRSGCRPAGHPLLSPTHETTETTHTCPCFWTLKALQQFRRARLPSPSAGSLRQQHFASSRCLSSCASSSLKKTRPQSCSSSSSKLLQAPYSTLLQRTPPLCRSFRRRRGRGLTLPFLRGSSTLNLLRCFIDLTQGQDHRHSPLVNLLSPLLLNPSTLPSRSLLILVISSLSYYFPEIPWLSSICLPLHISSSSIGLPHSPSSSTVFHCVTFLALIPYFVLFPRLVHFFLHPCCRPPLHFSSTHQNPASSSWQRSVLPPLAPGSTAEMLATTARVGTRLGQPIGLGTQCKCHRKHCCLREHRIGKCRSIRSRNTNSSTAEGHVWNCAVVHLHLFLPL